MGKKEDLNVRTFLSNLVSTLSDEQLGYLHDLTLNQLNDAGIPIEIFSHGLNPMESLVKYLREKGMDNDEIAEKLKTTKKTVWSTYSRVKGDKFVIKNKHECVSLNIFGKHSVVEDLVKELLKKYSIADIAKLMKKPVQSIYSVKRRLKDE